MADSVRSLRSVAKAAESGNQRELLLALRDRVAEAVNEPRCSARDLAPLTRRLQEITKDLADLDARAEQDAVGSGDHSTYWDGTKEI